MDTAHRVFFCCLGFKNSKETPYAPPHSQAFENVVGDVVNPVKLVAITVRHVFLYD